MIKYIGVIMIKFAIGYVIGFLSACLLYHIDKLDL